MPAENVSGFKAANVRLLKEQGISIARWPGGNFVSAYDWRDGIGDPDQRPPRRELAWNGLESNDMGIDDGPWQWATCLSPNTRKSTT